MSQCEQVIGSEEMPTTFKDSGMDGGVDSGVEMRLAHCRRQVEV